MVEVGEQAPDFTLPDDSGTEVSLRDLRGRPVVLYFYPADDTPGCTRQACGVRDAWQAFADAGAVVLGVSPDSVESHRAFREKYSLPFRLLADPGRTVIDRYDLWGTTVFKGREYVGVVRSTVLVEPAGRVAELWHRVAPDEHADLVLEALGRLARSETA